MPTNILMPALSPTMEKGNLAKWLKKEGDKVKSGDVIAEIETDKATMEVEAVDEGTLAKIVVPAGTADVPVNQVIAVLAGEGEDVKAASSARSERRAGRQTASTSNASGRRRAGTETRAPASGRSHANRNIRSRAGSQPAPASSRHRSRAGLRKMPASMCRASRARARMAAWWRATSKPRNRARD